MKLADAVSTVPGLPTSIHTITFESDKDSGVAIESASQDALSSEYNLHKSIILWKFLYLISKIWIS